MLFEVAGIAALALDNFRYMHPKNVEASKRGTAVLVGLRERTRDPIFAYKTGWPYPNPPLVDCVLSKSTVGVGYAGPAYPPVENSFVVSRYNALRESSTGHHAGSDFRATVGTIIRNVRDGYLVASLAPEDCGPGSGFYGYGGYIAVWHPQDGVYTIFAHNSRILQPTFAGGKADGRFIAAGEPLAMSGHESGNPPKFPNMPPHLHMEVKTPLRGNPYVWNRPDHGGAPFKPVYGQNNQSPELWLQSLGIVYGYSSSQPMRILPGSPADLSRMRTENPVAVLVRQQWDDTRQEAQSMDAERPRFQKAWLWGIAGLTAATVAVLVARG